MNYITTNTDTIFTIANNTVGLDNLFSLLLANTSLSVNSVAPSLNVVYTPTPTTPLHVVSKPPNVVTSAIYVTKFNQSFFDIALQIYGGLDKFFQIIQDNQYNPMSLVGVNVPIKYNPQLNKNAFLQTFISQNKTTFTTGVKGQYLVTEAGIEIDTESGQSIAIN